MLYNAKHCYTDYTDYRCYADPIVSISGQSSPFIWAIEGSREAQQHFRPSSNTTCFPLVASLCRWLSPKGQGVSLRISWNALQQNDKNMWISPVYCKCFNHSWVEYEWWYIDWWNISWYTKPHEEDLQASHSKATSPLSPNDSRNQTGRSFIFLNLPTALELDSYSTFTCQRFHVKQLTPLNLPSQTNIQC